MSVQKRRLFRINLLIHKGEQPKIYLNLFKWLLSSGRFIVVVVELVVIGAFVARYKFDSDLSNLQDKIQEQVPFIQSLKADEMLIRQTQFQLASIKKTKTESSAFGQIILKISQLTPKNIQLNSIALNQDHSSLKTSFTLSGQTPSSLEISAFVKALKKDPIFADIVLTNIAFEKLTTFTITGSVNLAGVNKQ